MTTEQLNQARADLWHQAANPLLTADDATAWLRETGICLFLPRAQQLPTAAPSFVEAVLGAVHPTPTPAAIAGAWELLHRLLTSGDAIALNLLGNSGLGLAGEQPDYLATMETLPFLFALRGDKEWKRGPRGKSSPLTIEVWKLLDREGPLTAAEVKDRLGRQLTEAAALRALGELWSHMRIEPVFTPGEPTGWQLLERRWSKEMHAGSNLSQAIALSALVSLYLQSAVAASGDEVEVFLSPLASRSKIRDVIRGLTATRQLSTLNLGPVEMFHIAGSLSEFPEIAHAEGAVVETLSGAGVEEGIGEGRRRFVANRSAAPAPSERPGSDEAAASRLEERARPVKPERRPFAPRPAASGSSAPRPSARKTGASGGERRPYGTRQAGASGAFNAREPWREDSKPSHARADESSERGPSTPREGGERRPFAAREGSRDERKPFAPRGGGERKPFGSREGGERRSFAPQGGTRPFKARGEDKPAAERKSFGERKSYTPRESGERKPFAPREGGERKSFGPRAGDRPFKPRSEGKPFEERKSFGERKPFAPREGGGERRSFTPREGGERKPFASRDSGERKPFAPREGGAERKSFAPREGAERKPFAPREGGERKSFAPRSGDRPFKPRSEGKPFGERKSFGDRKPFSSREGSDRKPFTPRDGADRKPFTPRESGERKSFSPRSGDRPFKPRSESKPSGERGSFGDRKPFIPREGGARKPFTSRTGDARPSRPSFGERSARPGGKPSGAGPTRRPESRSGARPGAKSTGPGRARTSSFTSSGKPRSGARPPASRLGPRASGRPAGRPGLKRTGRPKKGPSK